MYIEAACFFTDAKAFYRKWLADVRDAQEAGGTGQLPMFAPLAAMGPKIGAFDGGPAWADAGAALLPINQSSSVDVPAQCGKNR